MLADDVVAFPFTPLFRRLPQNLRLGYQMLAAETLQAQKFELRRGAVFLIQSVSNGAPSRLLPALKICRLPFPKMWIEFAYAHRTEWYQSEKLIGKLRDFEDSSPPKRMGFLLEQNDDVGRLIRATPVWKHNDNEGIVIGGYGLKMDTTEDFELTPAKRAEVLNLRETAVDKKFRDATHADPLEDEAFLELQARIRGECSLYMAPVWDHIERHQPERLQNMIERSLYDLLHEWSFIIALLTVLNSRNVVSYSPELTFEKLNKARAKKGAPPFTSRTIFFRLNRSWGRFRCHIFKKLVSTD